MIIFFNGSFVEAENASFDFQDRGLNLGDGLFETIKVTKGVPQRVLAHLKRLYDGLLAIDFPEIMNIDDFVHAITQTIKENSIENGIVRLTVTRGPGPRGIDPPLKSTPTIMVTVEATLESKIKPVNAIISKCTRRNEFSPTSGLKTLNYLDNIIARLEALKLGAHDALLLNTIGAVAEATTSNLFVVIDGHILTPPKKDGVLPGVMRADVIQATGAIEQTLGPHAFSEISEAFLTNSLGINPLIKVDEQEVGNGQIGPVCQRLQAIV